MTEPAKSEGIFQIGAILETGSLFNRRIWVIDRETPTQFVVTELKWSPDCIKEAGCVRRSDRTERIKKRPYLYKKPMGGFLHRDTPITILP